MSYAPFRPLTYNYGVGTAFGAVSGFNGAATWSDWLAGASGNNAAGMRAADAIRAALGGIGYGPFTVGVSWGTSADKAGFSKFVSDNGLTPSQNGSWWPTQQALLKLEEAAAQGGNQGGGPIQSFHVVDGQQIPGASPASKAAMTGTTIGLLVGGALILGFLAYRAKKKDTRRTGGYGDETGTGYMLGPGRATRYAANRSRKRGTRRYKMKGYGVVKAFERLDRQARRRDMKIGVVRSKTRIVRKVDGSIWRVLSKAGYLEDGSAHQIKSPKGHVVVMHDDDIRRDFRRDI